jgi:hypothetical protein
MSDVVSSAVPGGAEVTNFNGGSLDSLWFTEIIYNIN